MQITHHASQSHTSPCPPASHSPPSRPPPKTKQIVKEKTNQTNNKEPHRGSCSVALRQFTLPSPLVSVRCLESLVRFEASGSCYITDNRLSLGLLLVILLSCVTFVTSEPALSPAVGSRGIGGGGHLSLPSPCHHMGDGGSRGQLCCSQTSRVLASPTTGSALVSYQGEVHTHGEGWGHLS